MIDMTGFKMIYKDKVYNCLSMNPTIDGYANGDPKVTFLEVVFISSDNRIEFISDDAFKFQFINK